MNEKSCSSIAAAFSEPSDPRIGGQCEHNLLDIVIIALCATITGSESWVKVDLKADKLRTFVEREEGFSSHDSWERIFVALDADVKIAW